MKCDFYWIFFHFLKDSPFQSHGRHGSSSSLRLNYNQSNGSYQSPIPQNRSYHQQQQQTPSPWRNGQSSQPPYSSIPSHINNIICQPQIHSQPHHQQQQTNNNVPIIHENSPYQNPSEVVSIHVKNQRPKKAIENPAAHQPEP